MTDPTHAPRQATVIHNPLPGESRQATVTHNPIDPDRLRRQCETNWKVDVNVRITFGRFDDYFQYCKNAAGI